MKKEGGRREGTGREESEVGRERITAGRGMKEGGKMDWQGEMWEEGG